MYYNNGVFGYCDVVRDIINSSEILWCPRISSSLTGSAQLWARWVPRFAINPQFKSKVLPFWSIGCQLPELREVVFGLQFDIHSRTIMADCGQWVGVWSTSPWLHFLHSFTECKIHCLLRRAPGVHSKDVSEHLPSERTNLSRQRRHPAFFVQIAIRDLVWPSYT